MVWNSTVAINLSITPKLLRIQIPVDIQNVVFKGCVRVELTKKPPRYGAILVCFPEVSFIDMGIQVAGGQITRVAWLKSEIENEITNAVKDEFLRPKRVVIPSTSNALTRKGLLELEVEHWQHYQYNLKARDKESTLSEERQQKLEKVGFVWDPQTSVTCRLQDATRTLQCSVSLQSQSCFGYVGQKAVMTVQVVPARQAFQSFNRSLRDSYENGI